MFHSTDGPLPPIAEMARSLFRRQVTLLALTLVCLPPLACSDSSTVPEDAPEGHTVLKGGAPHAAGLNDPLQNCSSCHGANLEGGSEGEPSCTTCHGVEW